MYDWWNCRSGFSHLRTDMSESMNGRTDQCVASTCITVALRELSQAGDLTEVFSAHSQKWELSKRPCSPVGKNSRCSHYHIKTEEVRHQRCLWFTPILQSSTCIFELQSSALPTVVTSLSDLEKMSRFDSKMSSEDTPPLLALLVVAQVHTEAIGSKVRSKSTLLSLWFLLLQMLVTAAKTLRSIVISFLVKRPV